MMRRKKQGHIVPWDFVLMITSGNIKLLADVNHQVLSLSWPGQSPQIQTTTFQLLLPIKTQVRGSFRVSFIILFEA